jgi:hypothetical protein
MTQFQEAWPSPALCVCGGAVNGPGTGDAARSAWGLNLNGGYVAMEMRMLLPYFARILMKLFVSSFFPFDMSLTN